MRQAKKPLFPHEDSGLPCPLQDSWQRSQEYGLHRDDNAQPWIAPSFLQDARERNPWVQQLATPLLENLSAGLKKPPTIMVLSDATGLVFTPLGDTRFLNKAEHLALSPGHLWSENARGTNAIGTVRQMEHAWVASGVEPTPQPPGLDKQKALRILNAGIALCITGETGCGKEHFSRELYQQSRWRNGKFVAVNCAAIPENLIESELFGYLPGAFTGASAKGYTGKIREADGGILFLDEIGDMPATMQTRLLRVLQEKTVTPLGGNTAQPVDFALICATHQDLLARVREGAFREDLFYRIREFNLTLAPLREWSHRQVFIRQLWRDAGGEKRAITLSEPLIAHLAALPWPGNVRQLVSLLKVLIALADDGDTVTPADLPAEYLAAPPQALSAEDRAIRDASGNMSLAAKALGISRSTLYRRLERDKHQA
ncbi:sigma 54-interacting transcriptional regulator [Pluralibacter sp.]|uniref:sigma-54-dependent Fis family transcriptional regulator n=1 Tax=Pluralibacter sp. TaxID=1920032 RepID=UPI0025E95347|nr:sigma 54-interacting transcriptional regulator [Pluralibacter sp.]MBV8041874.1 sigma-54-dependent Fis family transcriptional regulator [Pluralibacter sp.]